MKKGDIVKTKLTRKNAVDGIKLIVDEIQEDAFSKNMRMIRGRRVYKNGSMSINAFDCPLQDITEIVENVD
jgi:hypothetical protein